jgi:hypothetical protein
MMPAFEDRLTPAQIVALAVYVHGLGGGQPPRQEDRPVATADAGAAPGAAAPAPPAG